jgi:hypothetical protein
VATLENWAASVAHELGVPEPTAAELSLILEVAREAAHNVLRPGAPVTTFLLGVAIGRGAAVGPTAQALIELARQSVDQPT